MLVKGTSEGSETLADKYLMRRIRFCFDYFSLDIIWKVILKRSKINFTKIVKACLNSPRQEFSNGGLGIVVVLLVCRQIDFFACVSLIGIPAGAQGSKRLCFRIESK